MRLDHAATQPGEIVASFDYLDSSGIIIGSTRTFGEVEVGHIFGNETWTRAQIVSHVPAVTDTTMAGDYGTLNIDQTTGAWEYALANGQANVQALSQGQIVTDDFTVQVSDGAGGFDDQLVSITITGTNDAPVITAEDVIGAVTELETPAGNLTGSGIISFTDVDLTDVHLVSAAGTPIGTTLGSLTAVKDSDTTGTGTGGQLTWTYTVAASAIEYLAAGQPKVESFTITLDDQNGGLITRQIDVTITGTNDAPSLAGLTTSVTFAENTVNATPQLLDGDIIFTDPKELRRRRSDRVRPARPRHSFDPQPGRGCWPDRIRCRRRDIRRNDHRHRHGRSRCDPHRHVHWRRHLGRHRRADPEPDLCQRLRRADGEPHARSR